MFAESMCASFQAVGDQRNPRTRLTCEYVSRLQKMWDESPYLAQKYEKTGRTNIDIWALDITHADSETEEENVFADMFPKYIKKKVKGKIRTFCDKSLSLADEEFWIEKCPKEIGVEVNSQVAAAFDQETLEALDINDVRSLGLLKLKSPDIWGYIWSDYKKRRPIFRILFKDLSQRGVVHNKKMKIKENSDISENLGEPKPVLDKKLEKRNNAYIQIPEIFDYAWRILKHPEKFDTVFQDCDQIDEEYYIKTIKNGNLMSPDDLNFVCAKYLLYLLLRLDAVYSLNNEFIYCHQNTYWVIPEIPELEFSQSIYHSVNVMLEITDGENAIGEISALCMLRLATQRFLSIFD